MATAKKKRPARSKRSMTTSAPSANEWRKIVASSLDWEQAHASFDAAVKKLAPALRGKRPRGSPHSPWELLEHIRITQADLLEFMVNPNYESHEWPRTYWPPSPQPPSTRAWAQSVGMIERDREQLKALAQRRPLDLTKKIPWGEGQTYLRTILVAVDHSSYHVGQLILVRRLLGAWD
jgi:hypothetical protein